MVWKRPRRPFAGGAGSRRRAPGFECHGSTGSRVPGMGKALRRERLAKGLGVRTPSGARDSEGMPLSGM